MYKQVTSLVLLIIFPIAWGCGSRRPHITAVSLSPMNYGCETGIPFYLPKPLLIIAKNFRNIETATVGLTDSAPIPNGFDDQAKYADVNARTNFNFDGSNASGGDSLNSGNVDKASSTAEKSAPHVQTSSGAPISPSTAPGDGLAPDTFFTYHIVFVPDMTEKYGLKIRGGPGEIRAAMNLVNGWQFTGLGPYYMKNSSTAQNIISAGIATRLGGQAVADVVKSVADLTGALQAGDIPADDARIQSLTKSIEALPKDCALMPLADFAEIHVYEPNLTPDGQMQWLRIAEHSFDRQYLGMSETKATFAPLPKPKTEESTESTQSGETGQPGLSRSGSRRPSVDANLARAAVAQVLGIPQDSPALSPGAGRETTQAGETDTTPTGGDVQQVQINYGDASRAPARKLLELPCAGLFRKHRGRVQTGVARFSPGFDPASSTLTPPATPPTSGGVIQSGDIPQRQRSRVIINQPHINQPRIVHPADPEPPVPQSDGTGDSRNGPAID